MEVKKLETQKHKRWQQKASLSSQTFRKGPAISRLLSPRQKTLRKQSLNYRSVPQKKLWPHHIHASKGQGRSLDFQSHLVVVMCNKKLGRESNLLPTPRPKKATTHWCHRRLYGVNKEAPISNSQGDFNGGPRGARNPSFWLAVSRSLFPPWVLTNAK